MISSKSILKPMAAAFVLASVTQPTLLIAQELVLEEVIVTAQMRAESLQDVPISVSAVSGTKMMEAGIDKIEDLQAYVPNLTMSETGIGTNIYIRGIGSGINQGFEQSVGMYVDGVSYGRAQLSRAPFLDLERVEVLRGPQNILFGKNSIAGALSITTAKPGDEFEGSVSALIEPDHGEEIYDIVLSGPVTEKIGARLAYRNRSMDGYLENLTTGDDEPGRDEETLRLIVDMDITSDLDVSLKYETGDFDVTGRQVEIVEEEVADSGFTYGQILFSGAGGVFPGQDPSVLNNTQDFKRSSNGDFSENSTENITLSADYALSDHMLTFILASNSYDYKELCDCDFTGANVFSLESEEDYEQYSFEARIASDLGNDFEYIGGIYYQDSDLEFNDNFLIAANSIVPDLVNVNPDAPAPGLGEFQRDTAAPRAFQQDSELWSVFAQVTWNISDDMRLTFGGRYSDEEKEASRIIDVTNIDGSPLEGLQATIAPLVYEEVFGLITHSVSDKRTEDNFAPLITGEWDMNEDVMLYATASQGYKSGGFDVRSNAPPPTGTFEFDEEEATSFEFGAKTSLLDGAAEVNVAMFFTQYDDLQVSVFDGQVGFNVGNAAEAETQGLELDGRWRLTESVTLSGAIAFLDFEFKDFKTGQCNQGQPADFADGNCDYTGDTNQYVADWSGNVSVEYFTALSDSLEFRSNLDLIFTDDYNPSQTLDPALDQDGYTKINARIAIADPSANWEVALIGKNLTDEEVMTYGNSTPLAFSLFDAKSRYAFFERERSVAIQGVYRF
jgi:outer membrane receptor protein involved in Fe transport